MMEALPGTLWLAVTAMVFAITFGVFLGVTAAVKRGTWLDNASIFTGIIGISGARKGIVYFTAPRGMLTVLLMRMQETDTSDENIKDLVGEVANTISGNARRDFGKNFVISVPVVIAHDAEKLTAPHTRSYVIPINWRTHSAKLVVCLE